MRFFLTILLACLSAIAFAQSTKTKSASPRYVTSSSRFDPSESDKKLPEAQKPTKKKSVKNKSKKNNFNWVLDQQVIEAEKRRKLVAKQRKKESRLDKKPQYNNPSYFGHKKKPKKRPVKRRKLCKECKIVH